MCTPHPLRSPHEHGDDDLRAQRLMLHHDDSVTVTVTAHDITMMKLMMSEMMLKTEKDAAAHTL